MSKFLIGVLTGIIVSLVIAVILIFAVFPSGKAPTVAENSTLVLDLQGEIPERPPVEFPVPIFGERNRPTVENVWSMLRNAAVDKRIKAVVLEPQDLSVGWGILQEIRADLVRFRKSGKPVYAFLKTPSAREYYLATAANRIYMEPSDWLDLKGMRFELTYFKNTLNKLGVDVQIVHAGKYKDFGDMFTRSSPSPETREVMNSLLDGLYGDLVSQIAAGRHKSAEQVTAIINDGPFISTAALSNGLVDELRFEDQMYGELKSDLKSGEINKLRTEDYMRVPASQAGLTAQTEFALVVGQGDISRSDGGIESGIEPKSFNKLLQKVESDPAIKGVIVRIDSPGGEVTASDEIWRQMNLLNKKKPMVISMSDVAASGGYYMAMTGSPIVAYPGTLTGSIGVVYGKPSLNGLYQKIGVTKDTISRGRFADIDSDYRPLNPVELQKLTDAVDANYRDFVSKVAAARNRSFTQIEQVAQGRVWLGSQAKNAGLVDDLGGLDRAIDVLKQKAHIPQSENVKLVVYPHRRSLWEFLTSRSQEASLESRVRAFLGPWPTSLWKRGGFLRLMPYSIEIR